MTFTTRVTGRGRATGTQHLFLTLACCFFIAADGSAQQTQPSCLPDAPSSTAQSLSTQSQTASQGTNPLKSGVDFVQLLTRKSVVFPDLATNNGPLSGWEKFKLAANSSVSVATVGGVLLGAAYNQATGYPSGYGQGGSGFGKRFGSGMARASSDFMFGTFLFSSVFHEDPRFYVKKDLSLKQAIKYSLVRVVVTRSDSGDPVVNIAGLLGPLAGETLSNTYWPKQNRSVSDTLVRYVCDEGWKFGGNLMRQYWPQVNRKLKLAPPVPESAATASATVQK